MRKVIEAIIKTIDDKNHVHIFTKHDIQLDSLVFKIDQVPAKVSKTIVEPKASKEPEKETKKKSKK